MRLASLKIVALICASGSSAMADVNVTNEPGAQNEASVAVNPVNPADILVSSNAAGDTAQIFESSDGGQSFTKLPFSPVRRDDEDAAGSFCYDTWLAYNSQGDAFISYECGDERVAYRKAGQAQFNETVFSLGSQRPDRDMLTVDVSSSSPFKGSVYVGYDDMNTGNTPRVVLSRDGFGNWEIAAPIADSNAIGVNVATGPQGQVFATWENYSGRKIMTAASLDGGAHFGAPMQVHAYAIDTGTLFVHIPPQSGRGMIPFPMTAVAQGGAFAGRLYVVYTDSDASGPATAIYLRHSDDGGASWSDAVRVNDDAAGNYHFQPSIAVSPAGVIGVSFYDTRNDSDAKRTDRYFSFSADGGATWAPNLRVSAAMSDESEWFSHDEGQYGDYQGMAADPSGGFHLAWTDSRPGTLAEDVFYASVGLREVSP